MARIGSPIGGGSGDNKDDEDDDRERRKRRGGRRATTSDVRSELDEVTAPPEETDESGMPSMIETGASQQSGTPDTGGRARAPEAPAQDTGSTAPAPDNQQNTPSTGGVTAGPAVDDTSGAPDVGDDVQATPDTGGIANQPGENEQGGIETEVAGAAERTKKAVAEENENIEESDIELEGSTDEGLLFGLTDRAKRERAEEFIDRRGGQIAATADMMGREARGDFMEFPEAGRVTPGGAHVPGSGIVDNPTPGLEHREPGSKGSPEQFGDFEIRIPGPGGNQRLDTILRESSDTITGAFQDASETLFEGDGVASESIIAEGLEAAGHDELATDFEETLRSGGKAGVEGLGFLVDVPGLALGAKEGVELAGAGAQATFEGEGLEFATDVKDTGLLVAERGFESARENPARTVGLAGGTLLGSYGIMRGAARLSPRAGSAARWAIQPGEEALGKGGFALTKKVKGEGAAQKLFPNKEPLIFSEEAALRGARSASQRIRGINAPDVSFGGLSDSFSGLARGIREGRIRTPGIEFVDRNEFGLVSTDPAFRRQLRTIKETARDPQNPNPLAAEARAEAGIDETTEPMLELGRPLATDIDNPPLSSRISQGGPGLGRPLATDFNAGTLETAAFGAGRSLRNRFMGGDTPGLGRPITTDFDDAVTIEALAAEGAGEVARASRGLIRGLNDAPGPGTSRPLATDLDVPTVETALFDLGARTRATFRSPDQVDLGRPLATEFEDAETLETVAFGAGRTLRDVGDRLNVDVGSSSFDTDRGRPLAGDFDDAATLETAAFGAGRNVRSFVAEADFSVDGEFNTDLGRPLATDFDDAVTAETLAFGAGRQTRRLFERDFDIGSDTFDTDRGRPLATDFDDAVTAETLAFQAGRSAQDLAPRLDLGSDQFNTDLGRPLATDFDDAATLETAAFGAGRRAREATPSLISGDRTPLESGRPAENAPDLGVPLQTDIRRRREPRVLGPRFGRPLATDFDDAVTAETLAFDAGAAGQQGAEALADVTRRGVGRVQEGVSTLANTGIRFTGGQPPARGPPELQLGGDQPADAALIENFGEPFDTSFETDFTDPDPDPMGGTGGDAGDAVVDVGGGQLARIRRAQQPSIAVEAQTETPELEDAARLETATEPEFDDAFRTQFRGDELETGFTESTGLETGAVEGELEGMGIPERVEALSESRGIFDQEFEGLAREPGERAGREFEQGFGFDREQRQRQEFEFEWEFEQEQEQIREQEQELEAELFDINDGREGRRDRGMGFDVRQIEFDVLSASDVVFGDDLDDALKGLDDALAF